MVVTLNSQADGGIAVTAVNGHREFGHRVPAEALRRVRHLTDGLLEDFEQGQRPLADPVALAQLGAGLRDTFFLPFYGDFLDQLGQGEARLHFASSVPDCLNLPWELLPGRDGSFLVADGRIALRRGARTDLPPPVGGLVAPPLRILFCACAPLDPHLPSLDYEKEDAILRIADKLGGRIHLEIAEAGAFDELRELISERKPHVVHLSGHGSARDGIGRFAFESDRGREDGHEGLEMAERLFAGRGVRLVFVSGCQSAHAGVAGLCQSLTGAGHVPLALGWGASIADDRATQFARCFHHELAVGRPVDRAVAAARRDLLEHGRIRLGGADLLDASFALPQLYAAEAADELVDDRRPPERPDRPGVRYELLGDNIRGLREGFVGRRRVLQRTRPALRDGSKTAMLCLTRLVGVWSNEH